MDYTPNPPGAWLDTKVLSGTMPSRTTSLTRPCGNNYRQRPSQVVARALKGGKCLSDRIAKDRPS